MEAAFETLGAQPLTGLLKTEVQKQHLCSRPGSSSNFRQILLRELQRIGEPLSDAELARCIQTLASLMPGDEEEGLPPELTAVDFAEKILGFETAGAVEDNTLAEVAKTEEAPVTSGKMAGAEGDAEYDDEDGDQ